MRPSSISSLLMRVALCGILALPIVAEPAALGEATVRSSIGQRLDADIDIASLSAAEAESLVVRLASADTFASAGIDYTALLRSLRFSVDKQGDRYRVRVTSDLPVSEPFLTLLVEMSANGARTIRQYALLIDPPSIDKPAEADTAGLAPGTPSAEDARADARGTTAVAAPAATPAQRVVRRGETLRSVASALQPEGLQLEQVMVALQNANPAAFAERNANRLRSGSVLTVPDADTMRAVDPAAARRVLRAQNAAFLRYQRQLAERSANNAPTADALAESSTAPGNRSSGGAVSAQTPAPEPPVAQDKLTLSAPGKADAAVPVTSPKDTLDKLASDKALADANSRIAALEKNIGQMQSLLELQNKSLADAQQRAAQAAQAPSTQQASKVSGAADAGVKDAGAQPPQAQGAVAQDSGAKDPVARDAVANQSAAKNAGAAKPVAAKSASSANTADLWQHPEVRAVAGGGVALLLLASLWARSRRRRGDDGVAVEAEPTIAQTVIGESGGRQIDTSHSVFHSNFVPSVSQIDANEVDAVAEADVYIAYGRDEQAEEILLDALRAHPQRHALRVKLLEIYATRKDRQKFGTLAAELRVLTHGQGPEWAQAAQLGQMLEPGNHLYGASSPATAARPSTQPLQERAGASPVADFELKLEGLLDERRKEAVGAATPAASDASPATIDFRLSGLDDPLPTAQSAGVGGEIGAAALTTKLELAMACRDIGDKDGARELLAEVAKGRDPDLAKRASELLHQLA